jgi:hypothetical protein
METANAADEAITKINDVVISRTRRMCDSVLLAVKFTGRR